MTRANLSLVAVVLLIVLLSQCTNAPTLLSIQITPNAPMVWLHFRRLVVQLPS
jgi:hypothetical protein